MSDLTYIERKKLEKVFKMSGGWVLDFSHQTLREFVLDSIGRNIHDTMYDYESGSKANRLRAVWTKEPNHVVGKLISDLVEYARLVGVDPELETLHDECKGIAARLSQGSPVEAIDAISADQSDGGFEVLARAVRDYIDKNEPELGLDRLHTYVTKWIRSLAQTRGVAIDKSKPLHSIFAEYVKELRKAGLLESTMTERILKSSIGTLDAFNHVRNNLSLAHDNPTLGYDESLLIFNNVCSMIRFVQAIEKNALQVTAVESRQQAMDDGIPF